MNAFERYQTSDLHTMERRAEEAPSQSNWFFLGMKYADDGKLAEAARALKECLELGPHDDAAYYLGTALFKLRRLNEAQHAFEMDRAGHRAGLRDEYLGEICLRVGRLVTAQRYFRSAMRTERIREHVVHKGMTALLVAGAEVGFGDFRRPILTERLVVRSGHRKVYGLLRVFTNDLDPEHRIAIFTDEADNQEQGRFGAGVSHGAENLLEHVMNRRPNRLRPHRTTFFVMHEKAVHGTEPMRIFRLEFRVHERNWWGRLTGKPRFSVDELGFFPVSHAELEKLIRFRFYWEA